jgi:hypothetical protein
MEDADPQDEASTLLKGSTFRIFTFSNFNYHRNLRRSV